MLLVKKFVCPGINVKCVKVSIFMVTILYRNHKAFQMLVCREGTAQTASFGILFKSFSLICTLSTEGIVRMSHTVCLNNALDIS